MHKSNSNLMQITQMFSPSLDKYVYSVLLGSSFKYGFWTLPFFKFSGTGLKDIISLINVWLDT